MNSAEAVVPYPSTPKQTETSTTRHDASRKLARRARRWGIPIVLLAAALGGALRWQSTRRAPAVHFDVATIDRGNISAKVSATGAVSALVTVSVGSQVSGRIEKLFVDYGSTVRQGQTVATLDAAFFRAAVAQAKANHVAAAAAVDKAAAMDLQAQRNHARAIELNFDGLASRADLEAAEADLQVAAAARTTALAGVAQAKAALEQADLNLRYTTIVSPIDGVVISRNVDVGQTVAAAFAAPTLLLIAQDLTRMQVDTNVAEADVGKIHAGMPVTFTVDAHPRKVFQGKVRQVRDNAQTIQNVVTYDAVIDVDNSERLLKPGMTASVTFVYATADNALRIPNAALRFKPDQAMLARAKSAGLAASSETSGGRQPSDERVLWVPEGAQASPVPVRIGISDGTFTEIVSGELRERGEVVVQIAGAPSAERGK